MEHIEGSYWYIEGHDGKPGSVVLSNPLGDTLIGDRRVTILEEAATLEDARRIAREWIAAA